MTTDNWQNNWHQVVARLEAASQDYVLLTVLATGGSTPRSNGTKMVVAKDDSWGSIGGGHLEYKAMQKANHLLTQENNNTQYIEQYPLGAKLGQCCGGHVSILFEVFKRNYFNLAVFGAGHVSRALMTVLAQLPCHVSWFDSREKEFPADLPQNVKKYVTDAPVYDVPSMPSGSYYLVMTHNHSLDFDLIEAILKRNDASYVGLIGSQTKWRRFQHRFQHKLYDPSFYDDVYCPVGLEQVPGKQPMEVSVSIAGQLIATFHEAKHAVGKNTGIDWRALQTSTQNHVQDDKQNIDQDQENNIAKVK